jgi:glutamate synthase (NADPH) small chain
MDKHKYFIRTPRKGAEYRPVCERVKDYEQVILMRTQDDSRDQASRCMDCGTPFCHDGCPIGNYIPEWNNLMFLNKWDKALNLLESTNPLPEITGRVCPALCEYACVLGLNDDAVTIRENELNIAEFGFKNNLLRPRTIAKKTGKNIAIVGSGPAGLSCAQRLNAAGHNVTVFERDEKTGGLLRYGIPDFKLEKDILDRRLTLWEKEGVVFKTGFDIGKDCNVEVLSKEFDAVCLACGCRLPRDINIPGRELKGIDFAMEYLSQSNKRVSGEKIGSDIIDAKDKKVVVIGGGDTGSDCVGTANRQGASCVVQVEIMAMPPACRGKEYPWPRYPLLLKNSSSHEEGGKRQWSVLTKKFLGEKGNIRRLSCAKVEFVKDDENACPVMKEIPGSEFEIEADMVLIAAGFVSPEKKGLVDSLGIELDKRGNIKTGDDYMTSKKGIFCAGDMRRGQSLVVWAIAEGLNCAYYMDRYLMGESNLMSFRTVL